MPRLSGQIDKLAVSFPGLSRAQFVSMLIETGCAAEMKKPGTIRQSIALA